MRFLIIFWAILLILLILFSIGDFPFSCIDSPIVLFHKANSALQMGDYQTAQVLYNKSLDIFRNSRDTDYEIKCLMKLGETFWNQGNLNKSSESYINAYKSTRKVRGMDREARFCLTAIDIFDKYQIAKAFRSKGEYAKAIGIFNVAINLSKTINSLFHEEKCVRQLSACYWENNDLSNYFELNNRARKIANKLCNQREVAICLNNIGLYYWKISDYSKALDSFDKSMKLSEVEQDDLLKSQALNNISIIYNELGDYENALRNIQIVRQISNHETDSSSFPVDLNNLGVIQKNQATFYEDKSLYFAAIDSFKKALDMLQIRRDLRIEIAILNNLGETFTYLGDYNEAILAIDKGIQSSRLIREKDKIGYLYNTRANAYLGKNEIEKAAIDYSAAIKNGEEYLDDKVLWEAYYGLGRCYENKKKYLLALSQYRKSIEIIDRIRGHIYVDLFKAGFIKTKLRVYECILRLLLEIREKSTSKEIDLELFKYIEKAKARAFLECLAESKVDLQTRMDPKYVEEEKRISANIANLTSKLIKMEPNSPNHFEILKKLNLQEDAYIRMISDMRVVDPVISNLVQPEICNIEEIKGILENTDSLLIEYFLAEPRSIMLIIDKGDIRIHFLPSKSEIQLGVKGYIKYLSNGSLEIDGGRSAAQCIYDLLLSPLKERIFDKKKKLIIIPDGMLYFLPFETLGHKFGQDKFKYLIEEREVSYVPSASALCLLKKMQSDKPFSGGLLAIGDPYYKSAISTSDKLHAETGNVDPLYIDQKEELFNLPYSREEINSIGKYFPRSKRKVLAGQAANEGAVKRLSGNEYSIIHFACHSFLDEFRPYRSALVLSKSRDDGEDGFLQVRELYNLRFNTELVILSACYTAGGLLESSEGIMGLPRIFFYTGARSVLSTLWQIKDHFTSIFMEKFYKYLAQGYTKSRALQLAKINILHGRYKEPRNWGSYVLYGEPWSIVNTRN